MEEGIYNKRKSVNYIIITIVIVIISVLAMYSLSLKSKLNSLGEDGAKVSIMNHTVLEFMNSFIDIVLKADGEVNFEDRLKLENQVRDLDDEEILLKWQNFVNSNTESEAQENVLNLLDTLVEKLEA